MNTESRRILDMLANGKLTTDEAERLLHAINHEPAQAESHTASAATAVARPRYKYLRVLIEGDEGDGGGKVNVRVPLALIRAGVKIGTVLPDSAREKIDKAMAEKDLPFDLNSLKPEHLEEFIDSLTDLTVEIDGGDGKDKGTVRIFCE